MRLPRVGEQVCGHLPWLSPSSIPAPHTRAQPPRWAARARGTRLCQGGCFHSWQPLMCSFGSPLWFLKFADLLLVSERATATPFLTRYPAQRWEYARCLNPQTKWKWKGFSLVEKNSEFCSQSVMQLALFDLAAFRGPAWAAGCKGLESASV